MDGKIWQKAKFIIDENLNTSQFEPWNSRIVIIHMYCKESYEFIKNKDQKVEILGVFWRKLTTN